MSLTAKDKSVVKAFWGKVSGKADVVGAEALGRMLTAYPQTKTYFSKWADLSPGSDPVKKHGAVIMGAIGNAVGVMDNLVGGMSALSDLHAFKLRVDPGNFKVGPQITHCLYIDHSRHQICLLLWLNPSILTFKIYFSDSVPQHPCDPGYSLPSGFHSRSAHCCG
uniref:Globin domain-containing protein n=1 Tax=Oncorhynchus tshawytscha TaxID=74940 RepID=A0AAZ3QFP9_ONCTS